MFWRLILELLNLFLFYQITIIENCFKNIIQLSYEINMDFLFRFFHIDILSYSIVKNINIIKFDNNFEFVYFLEIFVIMRKG